MRRWRAICHTFRCILNAMRPVRYSEPLLVMIHCFACLSNSALELFKELHLQEPQQRMCAARVSWPMLFLFRAVFEVVEATILWADVNGCVVSCGRGGIVEHKSQLIGANMFRSGLVAMVGGHWFTRPRCCLCMLSDPVVIRFGAVVTFQTCF